MRQLTVAWAVCGSALSACPPWSIVATQRVRVRPDLKRIGLDRVCCCAVVRIGKPGTDLLPERAVAFLPRAFFEVAAGDVVLHRLEAVRAQLLERIGQIVDRIVRPRP